MARPWVVVMTFPMDDSEYNEDEEDSTEIFGPFEDAEAANRWCMFMDKIWVNVPKITLITHMDDPTETIINVSRWKAAQPS